MSGISIEEEAAECFSRVAEAGLAAACEHGKTEEVKFLLHGGVDPNTRFEFGTTGLMKAAARGHVGVVSVLLSCTHLNILRWDLCHQWR